MKVCKKMLKTQTSKELQFSSALNDLGEAKFSKYLKRE